MAKKIYLAGPLGFSEVGRAFHYEKIIPEIKKLGFEIFDPWTVVPQEEIDSILNMDEGEEKKQALKKLNKDLFDGDIKALKSCDGVFAVLDGADVDSGTAAEIGIAYSLGKPILGYRGDFRLSSENTGVFVNLFVEGCVKETGGEIIKSLNDLSSAALRVFGNPD